MRSLCRIPVLPHLGLILALLLLPVSEANADLTVNNIGLYDGTSNAPTAWIAFSGSNGYVDVYADPQTATNWTSNGSSIALYCMDTIHENSLGDTYGVNPESPPTFSTTTTYFDAANRVAWVLENVGPTADARGAAQLLIWLIVDSKFSVNWSETNNAGLYSAYLNLSAEMDSQYNASQNYQPGAEFLAAVHDPTNTLYQDLAFAACPEPSTLVIAAMGALGLIGYAWRRRARPQV
jgi:PEP-CTERM motif